MGLIDSKALKQDLMLYGLIVFADMDLVTKAMKIVNRQLEVDAEPVRHGRWNPRTGLKHPDWFTCSECTGQFDYKWNYCPNCGAKMDEKTEGNEIEND